MKALFILGGVMVVLVVAVGFYRGWFGVSYSNGRPSSDEIHVGVKVDKSRVEDDARSVAEESKKLAKDAVNKVKGLTANTAEGVVVQVEPERRLLVVKVDEELKTFHLDDDTETHLELDDRGALAFHTNDRVALTYRTENGKDVVETIERLSTVNS